MSVPSNELLVDFRDALSKGDLEKVKSIISENKINSNLINTPLPKSFHGGGGPDFETTYMTPLLIACQGASDQPVNMELVKFLISNGADVNLESAENSFIATLPLSMAANDNNIDLVKYLISKGANLNKIDSKQHSVLDYVRDENTDMANFLKSQMKEQNENKPMEFYRSAKAKDISGTGKDSDLGAGPGPSATDTDATKDKFKPR